MQQSKPNNPSLDYFQQSGLISVGSYTAFLKRNPKSVLVTPSLALPSSCPIPKEKSKQYPPNIKLIK